MKNVKVKEDSKIIYNGINISLKKNFEYPENSNLVKDYPNLFEEVEVKEVDEIILVDKPKMSAPPKKRGRKPKKKGEDN
jgi:hypothetical protein